MVAIGGTGRGINKPLDPGIAGGNEHFDKARYVRFMTRQRILDGSWHRTQGRVVEHEIDPCASLPAVCEDPDIALYEREVVPCRSADRFLNLVKIAGVAGREVIDAHDSLVELQQRLENIGADEARNARDEPTARALLPE